MDKEICAAISALTQSDGASLLATMQAVQDNLRAVISGDTSSIIRFNNKQGLCSNCYWGPYDRHGEGAAVEPALELLRSTGMQDWPEFSGDGDYPVGGGEHDSHSIYHEPHLLYHTVKDLYVGEYGDARRRLAAHLLEWNAPYVEELARLFEVEA